MERRTAWGLALMATLTMTVSYLDRQTLSVLAPTVTEVFHLSEKQYGLLAASFSVAYLVGTPAAGWWIDRVGARRGLPISLFCWTMVSAAQALAPGFGALIALRLLLGLAEAPSFPGSAQTIQRVLLPHERARGMGVLFTGSSIGAMIAPKLATWLQGSFGWQGAFVGSSLVGLAWVPLWVWLTSSPEARRALDNPPASEALTGEAPAASPGALLQSRAVLRALLVVLASAPAISFSLLWGAKYLVKDHGLNQMDVASYLWMPPLLFDLGAVGFGDLASRRLRRVSDPSSPARGLLAAAMGLCALMVLAPLTGSVNGAILFISLSMAGGGGLYALATADMMARVPPRSVSTAGGISAAAQSLTYVINSLLIGSFLDSGGSYRAVLIALGVWAIPGSLIWIFWPPEGPPAPSGLNPGAR